MNRTPFSPTNLRCEYLQDPLCIDSLAPRFSWAVGHPQRGQRQSAYQVLVASSRAALDADQADLWNSGRVKSSQQLGVEYAGIPLQSASTCYWKVRIWDSAAVQSEFSQPAVFDTGLYNREDWHASWIGSPQPVKGTAPLLRKTFTLDQKAARARVYLCGLGYYELTINGRKVGDAVLDPGWTNYNERALYTGYRVDEFLTVGENVIGVMLGEGWYGNNHPSLKGLGGREPDWFGSPCLILRMDIETFTGTHTQIVTGAEQGWLTSDGPIRENNIYNGETYDARLEKPGWDCPAYTPTPTEWQPAAPVSGPKGTLTPQLMEPIRVVDELRPVCVTSPKAGVTVYDFGQNTSGWCKLKVSGPRGSQVTLRFAEILYENGTVNQEPLRRAGMTDTYILKGEGVETYQPRFTYHGFRYAQMEGFPGVPGPDALIFQVVRSSVENSGTFRCSSPLINAVQHNAAWTEASNLHSLPTDCPQRDERQGWLNDATVRLEESVYNFNMGRLLAKWENDIQDEQDASGAITDTAPYVWGSRPADGVCSSFLLAPWLVYTHYGDRRILAEHYLGMKGWFTYLGTRAQGSIVNYTYYGDWAGPVAYSPANSPTSAITPGIFMSTGYYYLNARILQRTAALLGKEEEAAAFGEAAEQIAAAFNARFFHPETGLYAEGSQAAQSFSLFLGLVPDQAKGQVVQGLVDDVLAHDCHLTTGNLCSKYILDVLCENGQTDLAYRLASQTTYPSWGYMVEHGATTIWERWEYATGGEMNSHNHPMYATVSAWFYKMLAGIQPNPNTPGYGAFTIHPHLPEGLEFVEASVNTLRGQVSSCWKKVEGGVNLTVSVPFNSRAEVRLPRGSQGQIYEGDLLIWQKGAPTAPVEGILACSENEAEMIFLVGSGTYTFRSR